MTSATRAGGWRTPTRGRLAARQALTLLGAAAMLIAACGASARPAVHDGRCRLSLRYSGSSGGTGTESAVFQIRNRSATACHLYRYPVIGLLDRGQRIHVAQTNGAPNLESVPHPLRSLLGRGRGEFVFFYAPMNYGNGHRCRPVADALSARFAPHAAVRIRLPTALNPLREQINPCGGAIAVTPVFSNQG